MPRYSENVVAALKRALAAPRFEDVEYNDRLYRGLTRPLELDRQTPVHGFYGLGVYFLPANHVTDQWGEYVYEYKAKRPLKLRKHLKSFRYGKPKRKDWVEGLPDEIDGIWFGNGAEGKYQIILKDFSLVSKPKKLSYKKLQELWP